MPGHDEQWSALVKTILRTPEFKRAPLRTELLRYLFERIHKPQGMSRKIIATEVFKSTQYDEGAVGERCLDLRNALKEYAESGPGQVQKWRCELPPAVPSEGYRLRFINQVAAPGTTGAFWQAHLSPARNVLIVYNEPLFYRDGSDQTITRYLDINHDQTQFSRETALQELKEQRPGAHKEGLYPSFLYLLSGEVAARDYIEEWFASVAGVKAQARIARRMTTAEIAQSSPILVGNLRTNSFMRNVLQSAHCEQLAYNLHPEKFGTVVIKDANEKELELTAGNRKRSRQKNDLHLETTSDANQDVYGIVTRIPNPYEDEGAITMISSDYTRAVEQIAHTLTSEHRFAGMSTQVGWSADEPLPACFQCLFAVRLGPVNMDTEARPAVLLTVRSYGA